MGLTKKKIKEIKWFSNVNSDESIESNILQKEKEETGLQSQKHVMYTGHRKDPTVLVVQGL